MRQRTGLYGLLAEFKSADDLLGAAKCVYAEGYRDIDAYSPFPVEGLSEAIGFRGNRVPLFVLLGGILGGAGGYFLQYYSAVFDYPINSGGRPLHSWPAFIPVTFELAVLVAAFAALFGMLILNGLPRLSHPVFNARDFDLATRNRFFLCIKSADPQFTQAETKQLLKSLEPLTISEVEH